MSFGIIASSGNSGAGGGGSIYSNLVLASSPLLYWRLDDTSGSTAVDISGNGYDGTYANAPLLNYTPLVMHDDSPSVFFDLGSLQETSLASASWMNTTEMTISVVCRPDPGASGGLHMIASRYWDDNLDRSWFLFLQGKVFKFYYQGSGGQEVTIDSGVTYVDGVTYCVVAYCGAAGAGIRVYDANGLVGSATGTAHPLISSARAFVVAGCDMPSMYNTSAAIQDVALFNTILPTGTIDTLGTTAVAAQERWINRSAGVSARNGTTTHNISFTAASAGSFLVAIVVSEEPLTLNTAGWTQRLTTFFDAEIAVYTRNANAGDSSMQFTVGVANYPLQYAVYEFPSGSSWQSGVTQPNGATPQLTGLPGTPVTTFAVTAMESTNPLDPNVTSVWAFSWLETYDQMVVHDGVTAGNYVTIGYRDYVTAASIDPGQDGYAGPVYTPSNFINTQTSLTFAINVP